MKKDKQVFLTDENFLTKANSHPKPALPKN